MFPTVKTTHAEREDELRRILSKKQASGGRRVLQHSRASRATIQKWTIKKKERQQKWAKWYAENGMNAHGFVKKYTSVVFHDLPSCHLEQHPFFHNIPHAAMRSNVPEDLLQELRDIEEEIHSISKTSSMDPVTHRYGANEGYNLGLSVAPGYPHGNKDKGTSGSVQWSGLVKSRPQLRSRLTQCLTKILHDMHGKEAWFRRLLHLTTKLNAETNETRTIPSLPLSGMWLAQDPKPEGIHCDRNVVGATFLLTTSHAQGSKLVLSSPTKKLANHHLTPGEIVAGSWANHAHCNIKVDRSEFRTSWTLYLDYRVFCTRHIHAEPQGFAKQMLTKSSMT